MELIVNGESRVVEDGATVAVEDAVVPKARWSTTALLPQQRVEVLTAVQGG